MPCPPYGYLNSKTNSWLTAASLIQNSVTHEDEVDSDSSMSLNTDSSDGEDTQSFEPFSTPAIEYTCNDAQIGTTGATAEVNDPYTDHRANVIDQTRTNEIGMVKWFSSLLT